MDHVEFRRNLADFCFELSQEFFNRECIGAPEVIGMMFYFTPVGCRFLGLLSQECVFENG